LFQGILTTTEQRSAPDVTPLFAATKAICDNATHQMKPSIRTVLAESHIAAVAIAWLLVWALAATVTGLWYPLYRAFSYAVTAIAIWDIPSSSLFLLDSTSGRLILITYLTYVVFAVLYLVAAWVLAIWVYALSPLAMLKQYNRMIQGKIHAQSN
jgi:hypothetical protein